MMSIHCPNLVAIGLKERLLRHIRCRYPGGYRFARPDRKGLKNPHTIRERVGHRVPGVVLWPLSKAKTSGLDAVFRGH